MREIVSIDATPSTLTAVEDLVTRLQARNGKSTFVFKHFTVTNQFPFSDFYIIVACHNPGFQVASRIISGILNVENGS